MTKEIPLTKGYVALVDDEDYEWLNKRSWYAHQARSLVYARTTVVIDGVKKNKSMHRLIMNNPPMDVDHINHDTLDNRRENLRPCTTRENMQNARPVRNKKYSAYKGVTFDHGRYKAQITIDGKYYYLGLHDDEIGAALAYDVAARAAFGEFAGLNFPERIDDSESGLWQHIINPAVAEALYA